MDLISTLKHSAPNSLLAMTMTPTLTLGAFAEQPHPGRNVCMAIGILYPISLPRSPNHPNAPSVLARCGVVLCFASLRFASLFTLRSMWRLDEDHVNSQGHITLLSHRFHTIRRPNTRPSHSALPITSHRIASPCPMPHPPNESPEPPRSQVTIAQATPPNNRRYHHYLAIAVQDKTNPAPG